MCVCVCVSTCVSAAVCDRMSARSLILSFAFTRRSLNTLIILCRSTAMKITPIRRSCGFALLMYAIVMLHSHSCDAIEAFAADGVVASGLSGTALEVLQHLKVRQSNDSEVWRETWCPDNTHGCSSDAERRYSWNLRTANLQLKVRKVGSDLQ